MSLAFVLLDFQHAGVRSRVSCTRWSLYIPVEVDGVSRTRTIDSTEIYTINFIFNMLWNGKSVQFIFPAEGCWVVVSRCQENETCSNFQFWGDNGWQNKMYPDETVAVVKPWEVIGSKKSRGCIFNEKPADWTNAFMLQVSSLSDVYDVRNRCSGRQRGVSQNSDQHETPLSCSVRQ